jgi:hypothetical protein
VRKLSEDLSRPVRGGEFGADMKAAIMSDDSIVVALGELKSTKNPKQVLTQYRYCEMVCALKRAARPRLEQTRGASPRLKTGPPTRAIPGHAGTSPHKK